MVKNISAFLIFISIFLCGQPAYTQCPPGENLLLLATVKNVSCHSGSDGLIDLDVSGGTAPFSYLWSNGKTTQDISSLIAGNYSVTVTDVNGCQQIINPTITQPLAFVYNVIITNVKCYGGDDGALDFSISGGNPPFSYTWVNTGTGDTIGLTEDINNLTAGIYGINVTDSRGCTGAIFYYVAQPDSITINGSVTNVRCAGEINGAINVTVSGGTGQKSFLWSTGANSRNLFNQPAGNYTVTVTDLSGCSAVKTFTITEPDTLRVTLNATDVTCPGANDGSVQTTVTGGTSPYFYLWSNGSTSSNLGGIGAGTYSVTVTDINGCTDTGSATLVDTNLVITATAVPISPICVGGSDGSIDLTISSGNPPYTFIWSTSETTEDLTGLSAGTYSVTITDANGCTTVANSTVTDPPPIQAIANGITNPVCNADSIGAIDISVTGGTPPYIYNWDNGATTQDISGLTAGEYCMVITDSNNCVSDTFCFTVSEPDEITITPVITPILCNGNDDGAIDLTVSGGIPPYGFLWDNGNTTSGLSGLSPGSYSVTVIDANGCTAEGTYTIDEPDTLTLTLTVTNPICNGASDGTIDLEVSGGTAPYIYVWSNGGTSQDLTGVPAGNYLVTVTDINGCTDTASATITDPDSMSLTAIIQDVRCPGDFNGAIDLTVTGGYLPYTYLWSRGDTTEDIANVSGGPYTVTVTDSIGCEATETFLVIDPPIDDVRIDDTIPLRCPGDTIAVLCAIVDGVPPPFTYTWSTGETTECIINVNAGIYSVTVADDNGCLSYFNNFVLEDPEPLQLSADITSPTCEEGSDGAIDLTVSGGNDPFQYYWSTTDTTEDISDLEEGIYTVHVLDSVGCTADGSYSINPVVPMIISLGITNASCNEADGSATVSVSGGTPPFIYTWSTGGSTATVNILVAGVYEVTVTDANACQESAFVIIDNVTDIILTASTTNTICGGGNTGAINVTVSGGTAPYTYLWSNGSTTQDLSNLAAGTYIVTVTDSDGCKRSLVLEISEDSGLTLSINSTSASCGSSDGSTTVTVSGGTLPYTYLWSDGQTGSTASDLGSGTHSITVTDANGCSASEIAIVSDAGGSALTFTKDDLNCLNGNSGSITLNVTGGIIPYSFVWSTGDTIKDLTGLGSGTYTVTVTDSAGCSSFAIIDIELPDGIIVVADKYEPSCNGEDDGSIEITVTGGLPPYSYLWTNGATTEDLSGLSAGNFNITVTDANGCSATTGIILDEPDSISIEIESVTPSGCVGDPNGAIDISVSGGNAPYTYLWNNGATTEDLTGIGGGTYCVVVTDSNNCSSAPFCITVDEPDQIIIIPDITPVICNGGNDGAVSVNVSGGVPPFTYLWDTGNITNSISGLPAGSHSIVVTDSVGCEATLTVSIPEPAPFSYINSIITPASCDTAVDGSILAVITGGTPPYTLLWEDGSTDAFRDSLAVGTYTLIVIDARECTDTTDFTVNSLPCNQPPVAITDMVSVFGCQDQSVEIPVLDNDYDPDGDNIFLTVILVEPNHGSIGVNLTPILVYTPDTGFTGIDTFQYVICDDGIPQLCDTGTVFISVLPCRPNIFIPNGYSPNGDGTNDEFHIDGIENFPDNELLIFNRWGNKVNEFHPYLNNWSGENKDGKDLPDGTYFYILKLNDSANTTFTGYIVINR